MLFRSGFVSRLPHELVAAFRSTLQETVEADLLLHVIDGQSPQRSAQIADVEQVLAQIGADEVPRIEVFNKIDLMPDTSPRTEFDEHGKPTRIWLSAVSGAGIDGLMDGLAQTFSSDIVRGLVRLGPADGRLRALLFEQGAVVRENHAKQGGWELDVTLRRRDYERLTKHEPTLANLWQDPAESAMKTG